MEWIKNIFLFIKSRLNTAEKKLIQGAFQKYKKDNSYQISNYETCRSFINIAHKLDLRMDYLIRRDKKETALYKELEDQQDFIRQIIKDYAL